MLYAWAVNIVMQNAIKPNYAILVARLKSCLHMSRHLMQRYTARYMIAGKWPTLANNKDIIILSCIFYENPRTLTAQQAKKKVSLLKSNGLL